MISISMFWRRWILFGLLVVSLLLTACDDIDFFHEEAVDGDGPILATDQIYHLIPIRVKMRQSWGESIGHVMDDLGIPKTKGNVCSVEAIVEQESSFSASPSVPNLGDKAINAFNKEIPQKFNEKFGRTLGPAMVRYFNFVLQNEPDPQNNFLEQMRVVRTEQELDNIYRQIFDYVTKQFHAGLIANAAKLMGKDYGEEMNPITTLGSMQVQVSYAQEHMRGNMDANQLRDYLYTQDGGLYYGIHRLLKYPAAYDKPIYRFADYNSGMYSSRNAAIQYIVAQLAGVELSLDGDLLSYDKNNEVITNMTQTETAINQIFADHHIALSADDIRKDLLKEKKSTFEQTKTYTYLKKLYQQATQKEAPYAMMPQVLITGPKLNRDYNTNWYASNVNRRYQQCMHRVVGKLKRSRHRS